MTAENIQDPGILTEPPFREVVLEIDSPKTGAELAVEIYERLNKHYVIEGISGR